MWLADFELILPVQVDTLRTISSRLRAWVQKLGEWVEEEAIDSDNCHTDSPDSDEGGKERWHY